MEMTRFGLRKHVVGWLRLPVGLALLLTFTGVGSFREPVTRAQGNEVDACSAQFAG